MNEILYSFPSNSSEEMMYIYLGIGIFIICCFLFFYAIKKNLSLLLMFSGFIGVMALGTAFFSFWKKSAKLPPVELYQEGISTPEGKVHFNTIKKIDFLTEEQFSKFPIQQAGKRFAIDTMKLIMVEEYSGKVHIISEENYPIRNIFEQLRPLVKTYREKN